MASPAGGGASVVTETGVPVVVPVTVPDVAEPDVAAAEVALAEVPETVAPLTVAELPGVFVIKASQQEVYGVVPELKIQYHWKV